MISECPHANYTPNDVYIEGSELVYEDNHDGTTHQGKDQFNSYCGNCGEWLSVVLNSSETHPHTYTDGVCVCGAMEPECTHANYTPNDVYIEGSELVYEDNHDGATHQVKDQFNRYCGNCGESDKQKCMLGLKLRSSSNRQILPHLPHIIRSP